MAQEFHVVRCFSCQSFQVQQVKKVNRWSCKLCGEKQSLVKEYGRGSGADCRRHVQKLNAMRGAMMEEQERHTWSLWEAVEAEDQGDRPVAQPQVTQQQVTQQQVTRHQGTQHQGTQHQVSRWSKYLDPPEEEEEEEEPTQSDLIDRQHLHFNNIFERKRKRSEDQADAPEQIKTFNKEEDTTKFRPLLPVPSMFESGEDFCFDEDDFLTQHGSLD
ncbi:MRN complex-interacting protein isoform X2 [Mugil cephalus]|uniref:MRN complex-interacting protein isoform X2 n=1 Tax=Mugil cephalus TaxID=48193 RepID=UPI001FB7B713|nr:MRN complex-interacting protein isoform X2 [Mugil cephalus]